MGPDNADIGPVLKPDEVSKHLTHGQIVMSLCKTPDKSLDFWYVTSV